jgi:hypothetical protein
VRHGLGVETGDGMRRKLLTLAAAVSAVLCVGACVLWVRSCWRYDELVWTRRQRVGSCGEHLSLGVVSEAGQLDFHSQWYEENRLLASDWPADGTVERRHGWSVMPAVRGRYHQLSRWGFSYGSIRRPDLVSRSVLVPHWFVVGLTGVAAAVGSRWSRHHGRPARGLCPACGYDLRATPDRCPECGVIPRPPAPGVAA